MKTIEYYLMRHASYYDFRNQYVTYQGMINLKISMDQLSKELNARFPKKKLHIIHSDLPRATHTSLLMRDMLENIQIFITSDPRLNSDGLQISDDYIHEVVGSCEKENEICLILSHLPDIEYFCNKRLGTSEWSRMNVELKEKSVPTPNPSDYLPF